MQPFDYTRPTTIDEAIQAVNTSTQFLAGGTDMLTRMKAGIAAPDRLADIKRLDDLPSGIRESDDGLSIGALTTLTEIETSDLLQERYTALSEAASLAATPQLRNMATLGGNLLQRPRCWYFRNSLFNCWLKGGDACPAQQGENEFHALFGYDKVAGTNGSGPTGSPGDNPCCAVHPSDLATALLALNASVRLRGPNGERTLALADFYALPEPDRRRETTIADDELILSIELPLPNGARSTYFKAMDRKVWAFALVSVAAAAQVENGRVANARVVLGGVAPVPWRSAAAEELLNGSEPSDSLFSQAADAALADAQPLQHNGYKVPLAKGLIQQALAALA